MKKLLIISGLALITLNAGAQTGYNVQSKKPVAGTEKPVNNPNQVTNYYQNNSAYNNNSTQSNKQGNPADANTATSHGNYVDPTRNNRGGLNNGANSGNINTHGTLNNGTGGNGTNGNVNTGTAR